MMVEVLWYTTEKGSNCPINDVTAHLSACIHASEELGYRCGYNHKCNGIISDPLSNPAGCFYTNKEDSFLNTVILPYKTMPNEHTGGICSMISMSTQCSCFKRIDHKQLLNILMESNTY